MASLLIDIEARFAKFQDSLDQVSRDVQRQVRGMDRAFGAIGASLAGIGAALGAGAVGSAIANIVGGLADLDDAAEKSGASVESLSSLLNTLAPTGVSLEQISDVAGKLTKAMAGADEESSKAAEAFKALGIETKDSAGNLRSVDSVLTDLADALSQYADGTNKTAIAQALLGKSGAEYLPLLKDLATRQRESASVTGEQAAAAEQLANAWRTLGTETQRLSQSLAGPLLTSLAQIIERFNAAGTSSENFYNRLRLAFQPEREIGRLQKNVADLERELSGLQNLRVIPEDERDRIAEVEKVTRKLTQARKELADAQPVRALIDPAAALGEVNGSPGRVTPGQAPKLSGGDTKAAAKAQISDAERLTRALEDQLFSSLKLSEVEKLRADIARGRVKFDTEGQQARALNAAAQVDSIKSITQAAEDESKAALNRIRVYEELEAAQGQANESAEKSLRDQISAWEDLADPTRKYQKELERINELLGQNRISAEQADQFRRAQLDGLVSLYEKQNKSAEDAKDAARDLGLTFQSAFEDAVLEGERLSKVLQSLAKDIARVFIRKAITEPLVGALTSSLGSLAGSLFGGGGGDELNPYVGLATKATGSASAITPSIVQNFDMTNSAVSENIVKSAAALGAAQARASLYDDRVRGREVFA